MIIIVKEETKKTLEVYTEGFDFPTNAKMQKFKKV